MIKADKVSLPHGAYVLDSLKQLTFSERLLRSRPGFLSLVPLTFSAVVRAVLDI